MAGLRIDAPAKINLYLHVIGRRADGYHDLDSLIAFAGEHDRIVVEPGERLSLDIAGRFAGALGGGVDNLVMQAAERLAAAAGRPCGARITLVKELPVASGIGGGSADAAAALKALNTLWALGRSDAELAAIGAGIGADVPVCVHGLTAYVGGAGEIVEPGPGLPPVGVVLANPGVALSTASVFAARAGDFTRASRLDGAARDARALAGALALRRNDLSEAACALAPAIRDVLTALDEAPGCLLARLSGSGATCFGLFGDDRAAADAARRLAEAHAGWWVRPTRFLGRAPVVGPDGSG